MSRRKAFSSVYALISVGLTATVAYVMEWTLTPSSVFMATLVFGLGYLLLSMIRLGKPPRTQRRHEG